MVGVGPEEVAIAMVMLDYANACRKARAQRPSRPERPPERALSARGTSCISYHSHKGKDRSVLPLLWRGGHRRGGGLRAGIDQRASR